VNPLALLHFTAAFLLSTLSSFAQSSAPAPSTQPPARHAQAYLYIEPGQARFEVLIDLPSAIEWLRLPLDTLSPLPTAAAAQITSQAAPLAASWCSASSQGSSVPVSLALTQLIRGVPGRTFPLKPGDPIPPADTLLGFMWEIPLAAHPQDLQLTWKGQINSLSTLPLSVFFGTTSESLSLSPGSPSFTWTNQNRLPPPPPLAPVPPVSSPGTLPLPLASLLWYAFALSLFVVLRKRGRDFPGGILSFLAVCLVGGLLAYPLLILRLPSPFPASPAPVTTPPQADTIVSPLLRNIYRAFDHRQEDAIYDLLARSADGPLLKQLYLDIIAGLSLDESEAARVHVAEFASEVEEVSPGSSPGSFTAKTSWSALGTVGHWGHAHTRTNVNLGRVTVSPVNGAWKITALEILDQRRL
jgi:hypothetical protein